MSESSYSDGEDEPEGEQAADAQSVVESFVEDNEDGDAGVDAGASERESQSGGSSQTLSEDSDAVFAGDELQQESVASDLAEKLRGSDIDDITSLGADDLTPDAEDSVNIDRATTFEQFSLSDRESGTYADALWVGETDSGETMYITFAHTAANPLVTTKLATSLNSSLSEAGKQRAGFPDMQVDEQREAAVTAQAGADDVACVGLYDPNETAATFEKDDYLDAVSAKLLIGDTDIGGNITASSDGEFHPIDYDRGGSNLAEKDEMIPNESPREGVVDWAQHECRFAVMEFGFDVSEDDIRQSLQSLATEVDVDEFESRLEQADAYVSDELKESMVENIRIARDGEI